MCGNIDRCWSHDDSIVNSSICYFPCSASTSTPGSVARSHDHICTAPLHQAPSVEQSVTRSPPTKPWISQDNQVQEAIVSSVAAASESCRQRCSPVLCLLGVLIALTAVFASLRNSGRPSVGDDDGDFPGVISLRNLEELTLPFVDYVVHNCTRPTAEVSRSRAFLWSHRHAVRTTESKSSAISQAVS